VPKKHNDGSALLTVSPHSFILKRGKYFKLCTKIVPESHFSILDILNPNN